MLDVPELGPLDALVMVMAGGVNFNNVWAARGMAVDVTKTQARWGEPRTSTSSAPTRAASCTRWAPASRTSRSATAWSSTPASGSGGRKVLAGRDPGLADSFRVWGYDTCWGSFAQFTRSRRISVCRRPGT